LRQEPTISQIYRAFDDQSHAVYRRAMSLSRNGVVSIDHVLSTIATLYPELAHALGTARHCWRRPDTAGAGLTAGPAANHPDLRRALAIAYRLAEEPGARRGLLTPAQILIAASLGPPRRGAVTEEIFERLGLRRPAWVELSPGREPIAVPHQHAVFANVQDLPIDRAAVLDSIVEKWLACQLGAATAPTDHEILQLVRTLPLAPS
jgi:hypothetical protein